jgi:flagellar motor switch protein FliG
MAAKNGKSTVTESEQALTGLRKAAILLVSLDKASSASLLKQFNPDLIESVSREIASLRDVSDALRQQVIEEFHAVALARTYSEVGGMSYARALLSQTLPQEQADKIIQQIELQFYSKPFTFLHKAQTENLTTFIQDEHPQTIALILSHLPPDKSSAILSSLVAEKQVEVVSRISKMEQTSPEVIKEVERGLEHRLSGMMSDRLQRVGGVESVAEILNLVDRTTEKGILDAMGENDPEMVEKIRRLMFVFEDILLVNDKGIQSVLKEIESSDLTLALRTATEELKNKILSNMSERAAQMIKEEMEYMGPVRLTDVEAAQQKIVDVVRRLEDSGEIIIAGRGGEKELIV